MLIAFAVLCIYLLATGSGQWPVAAGHEAMRP